MNNILVGTNNPGKYTVPVRLWTPQDQVEIEAKNQLYNIAALPWVFHHIAVMPDVHFGKGATVGSVIAMKGAVSPAAVGVDIGCGMGAIKTNLRVDQLPENLKRIRLDLEERIPVGFNAHEEPALRRAALNQFFEKFKNLNRGVEDLERKAKLQLGTLGGGNHFIELCLDDGKCDQCGATGTVKQLCESKTCQKIHEFPCDNCFGGKTDQHVWMMLHSGSRNIGKVLAEIHIKRAQKLAHNMILPDRDLAAFLADTQEMSAYLHDLKWAQEYAFLNRRVMFDLYKEIMLNHFPFIKFGEPILCHHNYVSEETHFGEDVIVTRKGAIRAGKGELGIIPGSMGTKSYIVRGLGNEESFCSASHGAGRVMSRGKATRTFTLDDLIEQTKGVECRKNEDVLDEIPGAYKDIDQVMANQSDLVEIVATLKGVMCIKG
jgi:tRNA-splicing ligase RtcB